jgi:hypothetical protein
MNDTRHVSLPLGPLVAAVGAIILIVSLFLNWYDGLTGWTVFELVDIVLLFCALLVIVQLAGGMGLLREPPVSPGLSLAVTIFAIVVVLVQLVNDPPAVAGDGGPGYSIGIWLAVAGAGLMVIGAVLATAHISLAVEPRPARAPEGRDPSEEPTRSDRSP